MDPKEELAKLEDLQAHLDLVKLDYQAQVTEIMAPVKQQLEDLTAEIEPMLDQLGAALEAQKALVVQAVLEAGQTVTGQGLQAVWVKGRTSWDTSKLEGLALAHPEILQLKTVGSPSVSIRPVPTKKK